MKFRKHCLQSIDVDKDSLQRPHRDLLRVGRNPTATLIQAKMLGDFPSCVDALPSIEGGPGGALVYLGFFAGRFD